MAERVVRGDDGVVTSVRGTVGVHKRDVTVRGFAPETAEQVAVEVLAERLAYEVKSYGIDTGVDVAETEPNYSEVMPKVIVFVLGGGVEVKP